jgi:hypothetical protein
LLDFCDESYRNLLENTNKEVTERTGISMKIKLKPGVKERKIMIFSVFWAFLAEDYKIKSLSMVFHDLLNHPQAVIFSGELKVFLNFWLHFSIFKHFIEKYK